MCANLNRKQMPEYHLWKDMRQRCMNPHNGSYSYYGGRGISVAPQWEDFFVFLADVGKRPSLLHTLDRYPNQNGNYEPGNVRWATRQQQSRNRRSTRLLTYKGVTKPMSEWAEEFGLPYFTLRSRLDSYGWSIERALEEQYFEKKYADVDTVTTLEAATALKVTQRTIYEWIKVGRLPSVMVRGLKRVPKEYVQI